MNIMFFCSPHYYYVDNLYDLAKNFSFENNVAFSSLNTAGQETIHLNNCGGIFSISDFLSGKFSPDIVILTQAWWLTDKDVASACRTRGIPFYIVEHAPQMLWYKKTPYRSHINGARAHFMWGRESAEVMRRCGCAEALPTVGAPRLELIKSMPSSLGARKFGIYTTSPKMMPNNFLSNFLLIQKYCKSKNIKLYIKNHVKFDVSSISSYLDPSVTEVYRNINTREDLMLLNDFEKIFFSFPSSVMIPAVFLKKPVYSLYGDHRNRHILEYSRKYKNIISEFSINTIDEVSSAGSDLWLGRNYHHKGSSFDLIKGYIYGDV